MTGGTIRRKGMQETLLERGAGVELLWKTLKYNHSNGNNNNDVTFAAEGHIY